MGSMGFVYGILGGVLGLVLAISVSTIYDLATKPDYFPWPAVTRCRICEKRVYVWQKQERRAFNVILDNPQRVACGMSASGIVHTGCKGHPDFQAGVHIN